MSQTEINPEQFIPTIDNNGKCSIPITDNPLFVIHPGFKYYCKLEASQKYMAKFNNYEEYIERLKTAMKEADEKGRTIIVYSPRNHMRKTMEIIGPLKNLVLIPNKGADQFIDRKGLGMGDEKFYSKLSETVNEAEVAGEFNLACVVGFEQNAGHYIDLYRNPDLIFPSDSKMKSSPCRQTIDGLLTVPKKDFLVLNRSGGIFSDKMRKAQENLRKKLEKKYEIKEGSCLSVLLTNLSYHSGMDDDYETFHYPFLKASKRLENISESSIRRGIKKLEKLGLVKLRPVNEKEKNIYREIAKKAKKDKVKLPVPRIMIESLINIKSSDIDMKQEEIGRFDINCVIRDMTEKELFEYQKAGFKIEEIVDIRGLSKKERSEKRHELYHKYKDRSQKTKLGKHFIQKRKKLIKTTKEKLANLSHIKEKYLFGSFGAGNQKPNSDIDILLVRESCPGSKECYYRFKKGPMDVFCFTEDQMDELKTKETVLISQLRSL